MPANASPDASLSKFKTHAITSHAHTSPSRESSPAYLAACSAREKLLARLRTEDADDLADRLAKCGEQEALTCTCCGCKWDVVKRCNRKWCPVCQRALATRASLRYTGICEAMEHPIFITLTVKNWDDPEEDFIRHLRRSFGKLRRLRWWTKRVKGGVAGIEVTNIGNGWHPHLHSVIDCRWLSVNQSPPRHGCSKAEFSSLVKRNLHELNQQWELCTGRKSSWKIKRAGGSSGRHGDAIAKEIIKYSVKGSDLVTVSGAISPVLRMLDGTRLLTSFGNCHGHLKDFDIPKIPSACVQCGTTGAWATEGMVRSMMRPAKRRR